jgi:hypothetical protein
MTEQLLRDFVKAAKRILAYHMREYVYAAQNGMGDFVPGAQRDVLAAGEVMRLAYWAAEVWGVRGED